MKVAVVRGGKAKVPAKPPSVNSLTDKIRAVHWEKCFIRKKKLSKKLQSLLSATSVDPQEAYKDLAKCIMKFHESSVLPVPINIDKIIVDADTGYAN